jgi:actin, other eukaryote
VAPDYDSALEEASECSAKEKTYDLQDATAITIASERFRCPELLFSPHLGAREHMEYTNSPLIPS